MKTFSKLLYAAYAIFVIFVLVLDNGIAVTAINYVKAQLSEKKEIADVSMRLEETELLAGRYYYPEYTVTGDFTGDAGLVYTSLDPEHLVVSAKGAVYARKTFEGESLNASIKVTSKYDFDFERVFTFRFINRYPENFSITYFVKGHSYNTQTLYVGVPVYVYSSVSSTNPPYSLTDHKILYNEEYFEKTIDGALVPKRATAEGETLSFTVRYGNGATATSKNFEIKMQ